MSSEFIPRLRRELVAAAAREPARRHVRLRVPPALALAAAGVAAVLLALALIRPAPEPPAPAGPDYHLATGDPARFATVLRERATLAGLNGLSVAAGEGEVRISAPAATRPALGALLAPGRFAVYDWEPSLTGAELPVYRAVLRAASDSTRGPGAFWLLDDANRRVLAGPTSSAAGLPATGHVVRVPAGTAVVRAEDAPDQAYVLSGAPALTDDALARARADRDPALDQPVVHGDLTPAGAAAFAALTRDVARRGAARHENQHIALVLDGRVLATPYIDYRQAPDGIDGSEGLQISGAMTRQRAALLAAILSAGPLPPARAG